MDAVLDLLFSHPIGLLSLFTILFVIGMSIFLHLWFRKKMRDPDE
ncbi:MAG: DUF3149 domain-containing protein [Thiobacillaceae bacterium]|jgi:hypothetical protein|nr:DUF3149 domain-containing protein [Thiobacillaceae bacterium]